MGDIKVNFQYPYNEDYIFETRLERINLDKESAQDIANDNGFVITMPQGIKKDLKSIDGIFSEKYGQNLQHMNTYINRYRCSCGETKERINNGTKCPKCGSIVKFVGDDFGYFGWIKLKPAYAIIHPNIYKSLAFFIGEKKLERILFFENPKDEDGFDIEVPKPTNEPYFDIGMIEFKDRFDEIMGYYLGINPNKQNYYDDIMKDRDKVFIHSIPVYTTLLRPFRIEGNKLFFEGTNANYNLLARLANLINKDELKMNRKRKPKYVLIYNAQTEFNIIYKELVDTLAQKKGAIRSLFGGRFNFTARSVIRGDPLLHSDEIKLPYKALVELLQQTLVNIIQKSYNCLYAEAHRIVYKALIQYDERIASYIEGIIHNYPRGIPILIDRNPTIQYGSMLQMYCIGMNKSYTMSMPLSVLAPLAADFDGDTLNILYLINQAFIERAEAVFNVRNCMNVSHNDGLFNNQVNRVIRDTAINANTMINLSREIYTLDMRNDIKRLQML